MTTITAGTLFRTSDLDDMLDHRPDLYDVEGIIKNATFINPHTGSRYWNMDDDELDELVWFHKYEIFSADDRIGNKVHPTVYVSEGQGSMTELVTDHGYPTYVSDNARDIAMVVKAAEATILSDDLYHLFVNRGVKRDSAESNTCTAMRGVLGDMGFTRVA